MKNELGIDEEDMLDMASENFEEELKFALSTIGSSSDYSNDRNRPYNG